MVIFPAIDLKGGKCVRLRQGVESDSKVYAEDPLKMALKFQSEGAQFLHLVDLDGAFQGRPAHTEIVSQIAKTLRIPVEIGGGLRTDKDIETMLNAGVRRVILGTRAISEEGALSRLASQFGGDRIVVGIDARNGLVQVKGWVETTSTLATDLAKRVADAGIKTIIYTDTATDGMLTGPNLNAMAKMCDATTCDIVASGGVSSDEDIRALARLGRKNLFGAIVGKALYEGRVTVASLLSAASEK